ncbi:Glycosyl phosphatidyl inositol anchor synthesis [Dinochytrium kinnereticum]|nr:Glycosyl phosphatidyl inositol anchor synthesis [Dinochytrium kinnereticum]
MPGPESDEDETIEELQRKLEALKRKKEERKKAELKAQIMALQTELDGSEFPKEKSGGTKIVPKRERESQRGSEAIKRESGAQQKSRPGDIERISTSKSHPTSPSKSRNKALDAALKREQDSLLKRHAHFTVPSKREPSHLDSPPRPHKDFSSNLHKERHTLHADKKIRLPGGAVNVCVKKEAPESAGPVTSKADFTSNFADSRKRYFAAQNAARKKSAGAVFLNASGMTSVIPPAAESQTADFPAGSVDYGDERIESYSGLKLKDRLVSRKEIEGHMESRTFKPLSSLRRLPHYGGDFAFDWVTIGVLASKSELKTAATGKKFCVLRLADLCGEMINVFLFGDSLDRHKDQDEGAVLALLNPQILHPTERDGAPGLNVDNPDKLMRIGTSADYGTCRGKGKDGQRCLALINRKNGGYCDFHSLSVLKSSKFHRQEFATGNASLALNDPSNDASKRSQRNNKAHGTYILPGGHMLSTHGQKSVVMEPLKNGGAKLVNPQLADLLSVDSKGARCVRAARGMTADKKSPAKAVFPMEAIRKLGFDPATGKDAIAVADRSPNVTPTKRRLDFGDKVHPSPLPMCAIGDVDDDDVEIDETDGVPLLDFTAIFQKGSIRGAVANLLIIGVVFHVVYSWSIFDIYFRSPLVHGMTPVHPPLPAPAKRLVLFVADGLRADKLFENRIALAPYLRDVVLSKGSWGVSHTRVPTESRPGHVALIAGFYEDVSAVTQGWKTNPVEFDSLFNETRKTWSFGSPDILPMFAEGATDRSRVDMFMYPAESEDFAEEDASKLDTWVFDKVDEFFKNATVDAELDALLRSDKIVFFLHLLGLDTNGHAHRPYSKEYLENIRLVDAGIKSFVEKFEAFYGNDQRTAFVFTADHGMSNRGNHGDGHPENTETPIIAWGAGVAGPNKTHATGHKEDWNLLEVQRNDLNQADIAPLMSTLIGVPYPMNSVGVLPIPYLSNTDEYKARAAFGNGKQILQQYLVKEESKRRTELSFVPFHPLLNHSTRMQEIETLIEKGHIELAELKSMEIVQLCVDGLRYYQTYDWLFLRSIISAGYAGWIVYSLLFIVRTYGGVGTSNVRKGVSDTTVNSVSVLVMAGFSALLFVKQSPPNYYLYIAFMVYLWGEAIKYRTFGVAALKIGLQTGGWVWTVSKGILYVIALEVLVYSYFRRDILTPCLIAAGVLWPFFIPLEFRKSNRIVVLWWRVFCVVLSVFTVLPVEKGEDVQLVTYGGILIFVSGLMAWQLLPREVSSLPKTGAKVAASKGEAPNIILPQLFIILLSIVIVNDTSAKLKRKEGLPIVNQILSWLILASCTIIPYVDTAKKGHHFLRRIIVIYLSFAPLFILLSISYEALFYGVFSLLLIAWLILERRIYSDSALYPLSNEYQDATKSTPTSPQFRPLVSADLRIAVFFLLFVNVAFFGTGNIASVSSFSLESVYRFTTVFNPFLMAALLLMKIWVPFFLLSAVFGVLSRSLDLPAFSLFLVVLSTTDVMTLNFFFLVRDDGSWLEIGTTISHFIIASAFIVFQIVLFSVGHFLVGKVLIPPIGRKGKKAL